MSFHSLHWRDIQCGKPLDWHNTFLEGYTNKKNTQIEEDNLGAEFGIIWFFFGVSSSLGSSVRTPPFIISF